MSWLSIVSALGVGSLVGSLLAIWLNTRQQHRQWVNENKKAEYRELLDVLFQSVSVVSENRPNIKDFNRIPIGEAMLRLSRVFADRIFIADAVKESKADEDFKQLKSVVYYEPEEQSLKPIELRYTLNNLHDREDKLRNKIRELAKHDIVEFHFLSR